MTVIKANGVYYRNLNKQIKELIKNGAKEIVLNGVNGQRYIGDGIENEVKIVINGTPGNDLAAFAGGIEITVNGNAQDGVANTMNGGKVIIKGNAGDILGYSMRGGKVYIQGDVGYRTGIHMKGFKEKQPTIIIGGTAGDFFGEYMAGGRLLLLGLNCKENKEIIGQHVGAGMHGGKMYVRGKVEDYKVGPEVKVEKTGKNDEEELKKLLAEYCDIFDISLEEIFNYNFSTIKPVSSRPYGNLYAY